MHAAWVALSLIVPAFRGPDLSLAVMLLVVFAALGCGRPQGIVITPTFRDLGQVREGDELRHDFTVHNASANPVLIESVVPSCSCIHLETTSGNPDAPLNPGDSVVISAKTSANGVTDVLRGTITLRYRNTASDAVQDLSTTFSARLRSDYVLDANEIDFGDLEGDESYSVRHLITLKSLTHPPSPPIMVDGVHATHPGVRYHRVNSTTVECCVACDESFREKSFEEFLYIHTTSTSRQVSTIKLRWRIPPRISVKPVAITATKNSLAVRPLTITSASPSRITGIHLPKGCNLRGRLRNPEDMAKTHYLEVVFPGSLAARSNAECGPIEETIKVELTCLGGGILTAEVPVYLF